MQSIEERLARLERSASRWRSVACLTLVCLVGAVFVGGKEAEPVGQNAAFNSVVCKQLLLLGDDGRRLAFIGPSKEGGAVVSVGEREGLQSIELRTTKNEAGISLFGGGKLRVKGSASGLGGNVLVRGMVDGEESSLGAAGVIDNGALTRQVKEVIK